MGLINELLVFGELGKWKFLSGGIKADHPFVVYYKPHSNIMAIYGVHNLPKVKFIGRHGRSQEVQRYMGVNSIVQKAPDGRIMENGVYHNQFACKPVTDYYFPPDVIIKLIYMRLYGRHELQDIFSGHFNDQYQGYFELLVCEHAQLNTGFNHHRVMIEVRDNGKINGFKSESEVRASASATTTTLQRIPPRETDEVFRWTVKDMSLLLSDHALVRGIMVDHRLVVKIPLRGTSRAIRANIVARNDCKVECFFDKKSFPEVEILRHATQQMLNERASSSSSSSLSLPPPAFIQPVAPSFLPSYLEMASSSHISPMEFAMERSFQESARRRQEEPPVVKSNKDGEYELINDNPDYKFPLEGNTNRTDSTVMNWRHDACTICQVKRAIVKCYPCGHDISCLSCIKPLQCTMNDCSICRTKITRAVVNAPSEFECTNVSFILTGQIERDDLMFSVEDSRPACKLCKKNVAIVRFNCGHDLSCIECAKYIQTLVKPRCPLPGCDKDFDFAIISSS